MIWPAYAPNLFRRSGSMLSLDKELHHMTFLVADDEPDNLATLSLAITFLGASVTCARNGREAVVLADQIRPTVILLDLSMPVMDGWEALKAIKKLSGMEYTVIIALTAHAMIGDKERSLEAGFNGYIAKPFRPSHLQEELRRALMP